MKTTAFAGRILAVAALCAGLPACATLQQIAALRQVDFSIDRASDVRLAGVLIDDVRSSQQISAVDAARIAAALTRGDLPLELQLHLDARNPSTNSVAARLLRLDWTLLLDDRETISGITDREYVIEPGVPADIPIAIQLDLADFFQHNFRDLVDLALAVTGQGGQPKRIALRATPTIETALGPIRYPEPITIVSAEAGTAR